VNQTRRKSLRIGIVGVVQDSPDMIRDVIGGPTARDRVPARILSVEKCIAAKGPPVRATNANRGRLSGGFASAVAHLLCSHAASLPGYRSGSSALSVLHVILKV
jgi:hypothetical protein